MSIHNPDRYVAELRQLLAQGRKRIGILVGAGAPASLKVDSTKRHLDSDGESLIPAIAALTAQVLGSLSTEDSEVVEAIQAEWRADVNIEQILSRVRSYASLLGDHSIHGRNGDGYNDLATELCEKIGEAVSVQLPDEQNAFSELAAWIGGTERTCAVEVFTTNYDLLIEEALERAGIPFFDGFSGAHKPFFDPASIARDDLPARWVRLWKLHGSLGWTEDSETIVRAGAREASSLIYPDHLKYETIQKLPFTALFDRLRTFLLLPDTLLISVGFSFADKHIAALLDECLSANPAASVFAFQYGDLSESVGACKIAAKRPNLSVYAQDGARINTIQAGWQLGDSPSKDWINVRHSFWADDGGSGRFVLGDFTRFCRFLSLVHADYEPPVPPEERTFHE